MARLMMKISFHYISAILLMFCIFSVDVSAQFKEKAFTQTYNDTTDMQTDPTDTTDKLFSFKELFGGLAHKQDLRIGTMFAGSIFMPGSSQIYNRQYWKLPVVYGGIGVCAGLGGYYLNQYNKSVRAYDTAFAADPNTQLQINYSAKTASTWLFVGAGLIYWGTLMDGVVNYKKDIHPHPGRATIYSILLPGLGQAYNGEYWKIPIYWGCLLGSGHFLYTNNVNYKRFKRIHNEATTNPDYDVSISAETAQWYRDVYRRYRDYSIVALAGFYLLQIIDANVFAYMHDFEVTDDITMRIEPAVIGPDNVYAQQTAVTAGMNNTAIGLKFGLRF